MHSAVLEMGKQTIISGPMHLQVGCARFGDAGHSLRLVGPLEAVGGRIPVDRGRCGEGIVVHFTIPTRLSRDGALVSLVEYAYANAMIARIPR